MTLADVDILVLAGGQGTRLRGVLPNAPKILAPVGDRPFLDRLLFWLREQRARRVVLGLGHLSEPVLDRLEAESFAGLEIETLVEPEPLGTGGAVAFARGLLASDPALVLNGDTFVDADLETFLAAHSAARTEASLLATWVERPGRYGRLSLDAGDRVLSFEEKEPQAPPSWINAGFFLFSQRMLDRVATLIAANGGRGSLERDVLAQLPAGSVYVSKVRGRFLDIGTPEALAMAEEVLRS